MAILVVLSLNSAGTLRKAGTMSKPIERRETVDFIPGNVLVIILKPQISPYGEVAEYVDSHWLREASPTRSLMTYE